MKFSIRDFFSKCDQIRSFLGISHIYWKNPQWKTSFFQHKNMINPFCTSVSNFFKYFYYSVVFTATIAWHGLMKVIAWQIKMPLVKFVYLMSFCTQDDWWLWFLRVRNCWQIKPFFQLNNTKHTLIFKKSWV